MTVGCAERVAEPVDICTRIEGNLVDNQRANARKELGLRMGGKGVGPLRSEPGDLCLKRPKRLLERAGSVELPAMPFRERIAIWHQRVTSSGITMSSDTVTLLVSASIRERSASARGRRRSGCSPMSRARNDR